MSLNLQRIVQWAQALSPKRFYNPELDVSFAMHRAMVDQINSELATVGQKQNTTFTATVTGDVTGTPVSFHTVSAGDGALSGVFLLALYVENTTAGSGSITFTAAWTMNGGAQNDATNIALGPGTSSNINNGSGMLIHADVGTDITWQMDVTGYTSGSAAVKMVASLTRLI